MLYTHVSSSSHPHLPPHCPSFIYIYNIPLIFAFSISQSRCLILSNYLFVICLACHCCYTTILLRHHFSVCILVYMPYTRPNFIAACSTIRLMGILNARVKCLINTYIKVPWIYPVISTIIYIFFTLLIFICCCGFFLHIFLIFKLFFLGIFSLWI